MPTVVSLIDPAARPTVLPEDALATLGEAGWTVIHRPWKRREAAQAAEWIGPNASAVLCTWGAPTFTPSLLDALPNLRFIGYCAGSVKHLVTPDVFARGVAVASAAPVIARAVGEYCLAATLWHLRGLQAMTRDLAGVNGAPRWSRHPARSLYGQRVGIISASTTARCFIDLLRPFDCDVLVYDPYLQEPFRLGVRVGSLSDVCAQTVVSVHTPDLPATRGLVGAAELAQIPDGGLFINSARSAVVNTEALLRALRTGRFHAVLDVFPTEPLPPDSPFAGLPNVTLSPHTAGFSTDIYAQMGREIVADLLRWQAGDPMRLSVDAARWELLA